MLSGLNGTSDSDCRVFLFTLLRSFKRLRRSPNGILHPSLVLVNGQLTPHSPSPPWPLLPSQPLSSVSIPCPTTWFLSCRNCSHQPPHSLRISKPLSKLLPRSSTPSNLGFNRCITTSQHPSHQRRMNWRVSLSRRTFQFRRRSAASARKLAIVSRRCSTPSGRAYPICLLRSNLRLLNRRNRRTTARHLDHPNRQPTASTGLMGTLQKRSRVFVCL